MKPLLYSFRRCPFAIRARLAISVSGVEVETQEVSLRVKPKEMLECSPKGTVPVLKFADGRVLEQSLDIMYWALAQSDPQHSLVDDETANVEMQSLIQRNDDMVQAEIGFIQICVALSTIL